MTEPTPEQLAAAQLAQEAIAAAQRKADDEAAEARLSDEEKQAAAMFSMTASEWEHWKTEDQPGVAKKVWAALDSAAREEVVAEHIQRHRPMPAAADPALVQRVRERLGNA